MSLCMQSIRWKYNFLGIEYSTCLKLEVVPIWNDIHIFFWRIGEDRVGVVRHTKCGRSKVGTNGNECFPNKTTGTYPEVFMTLHQIFTTI